MLDRDLAELYGVPTRRLNEQVKRNIRRFPENFMLQLSKTEFEEWRSQNATSNFDSDYTDWKSQMRFPIFSSPSKWVLVKDLMPLPNTE